MAFLFNDLLQNVKKVKFGNSDLKCGKTVIKNGKSACQHRGSLNCLQPNSRELQPDMIMRLTLLQKIPDRTFINIYRYQHTPTASEMENGMEKIKKKKLYYYA